MKHYPDVSRTGPIADTWHDDMVETIGVRRYYEMGGRTSYPRLYEEDRLINDVIDERLTNMLLIRQHIPMTILVSTLRLTFQRRKSLPSWNLLLNAAIDIYAEYNGEWEALRLFYGLYAHDATRMERFGILKLIRETRPQSDWKVSDGIRIDYRNP